MQAEKKVRQYLNSSSLSAAVVVIKLGGMFGLLFTVSRGKPGESNRAESNETVALRKTLVDENGMIS